ALLQDGFGQIVIGSSRNSSTIYIGDPGATGGTISFNDTLVLRNPMAGGHVYVNQNVSMGANSSFIIYGSGHTVTYSAPLVDATDNIETPDSVEIDGAVTLRAGTDGTGSITLGKIEET